MANPLDIRKIAFIGNYPPRQCGIATYTHDVRLAVAEAHPGCECSIIPVDDVAGGYDYPDEVRFQIPAQELDGYRRAADFINFNNYDVVCVQHEFGIYGGPAGSHILALLRELRMPVVTILHTILDKPNPDERRVMDQLTKRSSRLITMSQKGRKFLREIYGVADEKIDVIPHGIPDIPFVDPNFYKDQFGVEGKQVVLTFGLLSPNKGIEHALKAMPKVVEEFPNTAYIVLGATHPNLVREQGEKYRHSLQRMAQDLGIRKNVIFYDRFVELRELTEFIGAADIYVTPYLNEQQITSGTLAYAFGCGNAVVSTPYWHAAELLNDGRGVLVPFGDSEAIGREICGLLRDDTRRHAMRKQAYLLGRDMIWSAVAKLFMDSFARARRNHFLANTRRPMMRGQEIRPLELPQIRIDHLLRMTDSTGLFQHATYTLPNFREGYCTDDNVRGLIFSVYLEELGENTPASQRAATSYAAFLNYAFDRDSGTWRNFMSFDRKWLEEVGSEDSLGRTVWALGTCVGRSQRRDLQFWAVGLFEAALKSVVDVASLRPWATALIGIHEYLRRLDGDRFVRQMRDQLTTRLCEMFKKHSSDNWPWFENQLTYDNARLPHALILSGRWSGNQESLDIGLKSLRWLCSVQRSPRKCFRPIGSNGFYPRGGERAIFDQQPLEAAATVSATIEAYHATEDTYWLDEARLAFEWFLGRNDVMQPLCDARTGGCCDALHEDRVNQNQGAESTLSYLMALAEMKLLETGLAAFDEPVNGHAVAEHAAARARPATLN